MPKIVYRERRRMQVPVESKQLALTTIYTRLAAQIQHPASNSPQASNSRQTSESRRAAESRQPSDSRPISKPLLTSKSPPIAPKTDLKAGGKTATMTKAQQDISIGLLVSSLYITLYLGLVPLPDVVQMQIIPYLPALAIIYLGCYALFKLGYGVFTFNNVPKAHAELMKEIDEARADLKSKGVDVD